MLRNLYTPTSDKVIPADKADKADKVEAGEIPGDARSSGRPVTWF